MSEEAKAFIRRVVDGQVMSYLNDHPEIVSARTGKLKRGFTAKEALRDSISKRIVRDLCGDQSFLRLRLLLSLDVLTDDG